MSLKWWEKTVEYAFVLRYIDQSVFIAPLDGKEEFGGDAVISTEERFVLIEFKKDQTAFAVEKKKFHDYESARSALEKRDAHHHLVYGMEVREDGRSRLSLQSTTYFSREPSENVGEILKSGACLSDFKQYLHDFIYSKKHAGSGDSGGYEPDDEPDDADEIDVASYSLVAGVSKDGKLTQCMALREFIHEFVPDLTPVLQQNPAPPAPGIPGPSP